MKPMTLRLPDELRLALQGEANRQGRSLHGHIIWVLQGSVTVFVPTQVHTVVIPPSHPPETKAVSPPLDAVGTFSLDEKVEYTRTNEKSTVQTSPPFDPTPRSMCLCPAAMVKKGRHLSKCTVGMRGK